MQLGADPNVKGQYGRTPLYRAAFAGHLEAVKVKVKIIVQSTLKSVVAFFKALLGVGADPRVIADDGANPEQVCLFLSINCHLNSINVQVAAQPAVEEVLKCWDIKMTEHFLEGLEAGQAKRLEKERQLKQAAEDK